MRKCVGLIFILLLCCGCDSEKQKVQSDEPEKQVELQSGDIIPNESEIGNKIAYNNVELDCWTIRALPDGEGQLRSSYIYHFDEFGNTVDVCSEYSFMLELHENNCDLEISETSRNYKSTKELWEGVGWYCTPYYYISD